MKGIYLSFCVYPAETKGPQPTSALKMFSNPPGTGGLVDWWTGDCRVVWNPIEKICRLGPYSAPHPSLSSLVIERFLSAPRHLGKNPVLVDKHFTKNSGRSWRKIKNFKRYRSRSMQFRHVYVLDAS